MSDANWEKRPFSCSGRPLTLPVGASPFRIFVRTKLRKRQPFDTIKVRLQSSSFAPNTSSLSAFKQVITQESATALWKGLVPTTAGMVVENGVAFGLNEHLKRTFPAALPQVNIGRGGREYLDFRDDVLRPMGMGLATGCCSSMVLISSEVVKTRTQMMTEKVSSVTITKDILRKRGISGLFVGVDAQIMRDGPFYAVFFGSYEISKFGIYKLFGEVSWPSACHLCALGTCSFGFLVWGSHNRRRLSRCKCARTEHSRRFEFLNIWRHRGDGGMGDRHALRRSKDRGPS